MFTSQEILLADKANASYQLSPIENDQTSPEDRRTSNVGIYWHRELPPIDAEPVGERVEETASSACRTCWWNATSFGIAATRLLMDEARNRLEREVARLGGTCAHALDESVESRHDGATGEGWLHGRFTYMLYRSSR